MRHVQKRNNIPYFSKEKMRLQERIQSDSSPGNAKQTRCLRFKHTKRKKNAIQTFKNAPQSSFFDRFSLGDCWTGSQRQSRKSELVKWKRKTRKKTAFCLQPPPSFSLSSFPLIRTNKKFRKARQGYDPVTTFFAPTRSAVQWVGRKRIFILLVFLLFLPCQLWSLRHHSITEQKVLAPFRGSATVRMKERGEQKRRQNTKKKGRKGKSARGARGRSKNKSKEK